MTRLTALPQPYFGTVPGTNAAPLRPVSRYASGLRMWFKSILALVCLIAASLPAHARGLPLVRDAEIEALLKSYTAPIFRAAGLGQRAVNVYIVNNRSFNAFVSDQNMFIHTGALMQAESPNEIIGVIAHETGHIQGRHQLRKRDRFERAQLLAGVGLLLGAGAMATGGDLGSAAGQALIRGGQDTLLRSLLAYSRDEEANADRSAIKLLDATGQSGAGMLKTFERLGSQMLFSASRPDPYVQSHPLPSARIQLLESVVRSSPNYDKKDPAELQLRHDMARAKIAAYTGGLRLVRRVFKNEPNGIAATYGTAIAQHLQGKSRNAIQTLDKVIRQFPSHPYLYEMKAEMLLAMRRPNEAIPPMQKAIQLDPFQSGMLRIQYGHMLMETGNPANVQVAIREIKAGLARDPQTIAGYRYLARAYGSLGDQGRALAATAEAEFIVGRTKEAQQFARRAQQELKKGSPEWVRMQDIVLYKPAKKQR